MAHGGTYLVVYLFIVIIQATIFGFATNAVVNNKGYEENWFWWGFLFGFLALIVALAKPEPQYQSETFESNFRTGSERIKTGTWRCPSCSKTNQSRTALCDCGTKRPKESPSIDAWTCKFCDRSNPNTAAICYCGHKKSESRGALNRDMPWVCKFCGQTNVKVTTICKCGRKKTESFPSSDTESEKKSTVSKSTTEAAGLSYPIQNYYPGFPIKFLNIKFAPAKDESLPIDLECYLYDEGFTALRIEILITDIWEEQKSFPEIDLRIPQNSQGKIALPYTLRFPPEKLSSIKSVTILLQKAIIKEEIRNIDSRPENILLQNTELQTLRAQLGEDAVTKGENAYYNWTCVCGTANDINMDTCKLCKRKKPVQ